LRIEEYNHLAVTVSPERVAMKLHRHRPAAAALLDVVELFPRSRRAPTMGFAPTAAAPSRRGDDRP
jgi:hypothetical protein